MPMTVSARESLSTPTRGASGFGETTGYGRRNRNWRTKESIHRLPMMSVRGRRARRAPGGPGQLRGPAASDRRPDPARGHHLEQRDRLRPDRRGTYLLRWPRAGLRRATAALRPAALRHHLAGLDGPQQIGRRIREIETEISGRRKERAGRLDPSISRPGPSPRRSRIGGERRPVCTIYPICTACGLSHPATRRRASICFWLVFIEKIRPTRLPSICRSFFTLAGIGILLYIQYATRAERISS